MYEIDLHGLTHKQAITKVEEYLLLNSVKNIVEVKLITGNSSILQNKLIKLCDRYNFSYYIPAHNMGEMYVSDNEIL